MFDLSTITNQDAVGLVHDYALEISGIAIDALQDETKVSKIGQAIERFRDTGRSHPPISSLLALDDRALYRELIRIGHNLTVHS
ncbi:MAG: hypothetical protein Q8P30_04305 [Candidatus Uhrbacteria bacterium]|nr:hypothetical protein [Candidatus Uhrbacteria bacterium]